MTIAGLDRVRFYLRVGISVVATILTMYLAVAPRERRAILFRPGRAVLWATSLATLLFLAVRLPEIWLYPEIYGDLQWIVAEDFIFSPDSKPVYAVLSVFLFGLLSRTFLWSIDWVELVGYGVLFSWGILAVLDLLLYYWDLLVV